jgi:hypothetical protein|nr:MAG TPA: Naegleria gruberi RNA ligase repair, adenylyltransferase, LIGASE [Caudoviricetes sp.]
MIKKEIYPKTKRVSCSGDRVYLTEKLDGSNLVFFKKDDELYIAQRKNIFKITELEDVKDVLYKGLYQWLNDNKDVLIEEIHNDSAICGEWLGMGKIKYTIDEFDKKWYMFAKANIDDEFNLYNLNYEHSLFVYPFVSQEIPKFIGVVPEVVELNVLPTKEHLDSIYEKYCAKVNRNVEGFVINYKNIITKYVRMKNGKLQEHFDRGE